jgi:DNA polymerase-1
MRGQSGISLFRPTAPTCSAWPTCGGTRHGLTLLAPVHDAVLLESSEDRIEPDVALMREIMRRASRVILNPTADGTIELRTDCKIIRHPGRYTDRRGAELWDTVLKLSA